MDNIIQIHFFGPINISTVESLRNMLLNALKQAPQEIQILMSSEGGDLNSGFTAYNYIRSMPMKITTINMGAIESIAMLPFLAGSVRRSVSSARFLIHNFTWTFPNTPTDINRVAERANSLATDVDRYVNIFNERTTGATQSIDPRLHLTGAAAMIMPKAAFRAGIITVDDFSYPALAPTQFYDRIFK